MYILNRFNLFKSYPKVYILNNKYINNGVELSEKISQFKQGLINKINKLLPNSVVLEVTDLETLLCNRKCIDIIYPGVGHNLDLINKYSHQKQININYIYREEDLFYWNHSNSSFYKFKTLFYRLNNSY